MAGGGGGGSRSLEQTPTWAVAAVCFVLVVISIFIEHILHLIGKWLKKRHKRALYESLEKIKSELMMMGFISLLLTVGQSPISSICIPKSVANTWHPCEKNNGHESTSDQNSRDDDDENVGRRLLWSSTRRILAGASGAADKCEAKGKASFVSSDGIHQLHIFIFVLAVFHVLYCITTMALGRAKMRKWKSWEKETKTMEYQFTYDPERFRFARETSFGRRHLNYWTKSPVLIWIACFFRQFVRSVAKIDYLTLRHGFIMAHLAPQSSTKFDFQKYIKRSLDEDFKVVVGISPTTWFFAVLFLLSNAHGWYSYLWLPFIPLIIILLVGAKLQVIITQMGLDIQDRGDVVKGIPVVQPADHHFWFNRPRLTLYLIHFVLFQNAFQLAFFIWAWYEFGLRSCYHQKLEDMIIRLSLGVLTQFICSYVTLPLYALVTQMGSNLKPTIFNDRVAAALRKWHHTARKHVKEIRRSESVTPFSPSRAATPAHGHSPVHLLRHNSSTSPRFYHSENERWDHEDSVSPSYHQRIMEDSMSRNNGGHEPSEQKEMEDMATQPLEEAAPEQCEIDMNSKAFSFARR